MCVCVCVFASSSSCPFPTRILRSSNNLPTNTNVSTSPTTHSIPSRRIIGTQHSTPTASCTATKLVTCNACKRAFKGRRGLNFHYARSSVCKQPVRSSPSTSPPTDCDTGHMTSVPQPDKESINIANPPLLKISNSNVVMVKTPKFDSTTLRMAAKCVIFYLQKTILSVHQHIVSTSLIFHLPLVR